MLGAADPEGMLLWALLVLLAAGTALYGGYVAYQTRLLREKAAAEALATAGREPLAELAALNRQLAGEAEAARDTLTRVRETIRRGTKG